MSKYTLITNYEEVQAQKLEKVSYEEMLEMASQGAKVLQTRSVALAMKYKLKVNVLSSFENKTGTLVLDEEEIMEKKNVSGIAFSLDENCKITSPREDETNNHAGFLTKFISFQKEWLR